MALKDTIKSMNCILCTLQKDLEKVDRGNKAASQRVRTGTIKLAKIAKTYRKESVAAEKSGSFKKRPKDVKPKKKKAAKKVTKKAKKRR